MSLFINRKKHTTKKPLEEYQNKFIHFNCDYWKSAPKSKRKTFFLVEGLLGAMPTHLVRLGISAKALEDKLDIKPMVILGSRNDNNVNMFQSFGIDSFVYLDETTLSIHDYFYAIYKVMQFLLAPSVEKLLSLKYKNMNIGKLVYDDILHSTNDCYTLNKVEKKHIKLIWKAVLYIRKYNKIINKNEIQFVLLSHNEYIGYATLAVASICNGKKVVTVNDVEVSQYSHSNEIFWHKRFQTNIKNILMKESHELLAKKGENYLNDRIYGELGLFDVKSAFGDKHFYTLDEVKNNITKNSNKNVFIYMHVFSDAPHLSEMNMYKDYYDWICDTVAAIKDIQNVNWFIKIHPSAYLYGETDKIKYMIQINNRKIYMVPDDFNSASIKDVADAVVTCQGTVGIEASCMGIPVIITGKPFYGGFGFTLEPEDKREYHEMLRKCDQIKKLDNSKIKMAKAVLGAFHTFQYTDKTILDDYVYEFAGYGKKASYERAFEQIMRNMKNYTYDQLELYQKVFETIEI